MVFSVRRFVAGAIGLVVVGAVLVGCVAFWQDSGVERDPGVYYIAVAHRPIGGRPCETLQSGIFAFQGHSTPFFTPMQEEVLGRGAKPVMRAGDLGGYLEIPGGSDEFENRRLTTRDLTHVWLRGTGLALPVDHPECGQMLLNRAKSDGYDLRFTYPSKREPQNIGLDAYLPTPGHSSQECANIDTINPARIVNSAPAIQLDRVVTMAQIPNFPESCRLGRIASLASLNGKIDLSVKDPRVQNLSVQPYEGFSEVKGVDEAAIDLQQVDPKKVSLLVPVFLHPQRWDVVRMNALIAYISQKGVKVQPDNGSQFAAKNMQLPDTLALTPNNADAIARANCYGKVSWELRTPEQFQSDKQSSADQTQEPSPE